jgi:DNA polymerase III epsilon subunit-like protein
MHPYFLVTDYETSGLDVRENKHQPLSCGAVVIDSKTLEAKDEIYLEWQFNADRFEWGLKAEEVHGLTREYLSQKPTMEQAAAHMLAFLLPYWKQGEVVTLAGHNPHFDRRCMEVLMNEIDIRLPFGFRYIDTFSLGYGLFGAVTSEQLFNIVGTERSYHNALEDTKATLAALQMTRKIGQIYLELKKELEEGKL